MHIYYWIFAGGNIMQVKHTYLKSYPSNEEKLKELKRIYRQLNAKFQFELEEIKNKLAKKLYNIFTEWRKLMATAIYGRQSVDKKDSISIEAQIGLCKKECTGESNFKIYTDKGYSGKNTDRPKFRRMMQDVKSGLIDRVVVYRLDRLSRSITDFGHMWEGLNNFHVSFTSVSEKFDTETPAGRAMLYIIMIFAQLERETTTERVKDNYLVKCVSESTEITISYLNKQIEKLDAERRNIITSIKATQKKEKYKSGNIIFKKLDNQHKHQIAEAFISKILVGKNSIEIIWKA